MSALLDDILERVERMPEKARAEISRAVEDTKELRWVPNPGPQTDAYFSPADEIFYGGQAGGGKSALGVGLALTEHERSLILRRYTADARALADYAMTVVGSRDGYNGQEMRLRVDGRLIDFGGCKDESDKQRYKGDPHDLIVVDEAGDFLESQIVFIIGWNRSTKSGQRCRVVLTGNPPTTPEGMWLLKRYAAWLDPNHPDPAAPGELRWFTTSSDGVEIEVSGRGPHLINGEEVIAKSRTFIRSRLSDNPDLARTDYDATLAALPAELRAAYREGKFDAGLRDQPFQCIPTEWIRAAMARWTPTPPAGVPMCAMAADASGGGDDPFVLAMRHDGWFAANIKIPGKEIPMARAGKFCGGQIISYRRDKAVVVVDMGGGYGGSTYEVLKENDIDVRAHKGAEESVQRTADGQLKFANKRSQIIWRFREALDPSQPNGSPISLPNDPLLLADLAAPTFTAPGHVLTVEAKEKVCKRLGRSTDDGDAVVMCWSAGPTYLSDGRIWDERRKKRGAFQSKANMRARG